MQRGEKASSPFLSSTPPPSHKTGTRYTGYDWPYAGTKTPVIPREKGVCNRQAATVQVHVD